MQRRFTLLGIVVLLLGSSIANAQDEVIEMYRSDLRAEKITIITEEMAFTQEEASALYNAGVFLYNGDIVNQNIDLAFEYFLAASEQDEPNALQVLDRWDELV